jgi:hypothetical protein
MAEVEEEKRKRWMIIDKRSSERRNEICVVGVILMPMMKTFPAFEHNKNKNSGRGRRGLSSTSTSFTSSDISRAV